MSTSNGNDRSGLSATQDQAGAVGGNGNGSGMAKLPNPEVSSLPKRRRFSADYKARVVEEAEAVRVIYARVCEVLNHGGPELEAAEGRGGGGVLGSIQEDQG